MGKEGYQDAEECQRRVGVEGLSRERAVLSPSEVGGRFSRAISRILPKRNPTCHHLLTGGNQRYLQCPQGWKKAT
jgi:hypothetical protein